MDKEKGQKWIRENVYTGKKWDKNWWIKKFGIPENVKSKRFNYYIIKMYYFKDIDMTIMVNEYKGLIDLYRTGRCDN